ncbi:MAG: T9SS type A sorting domain-containing protein [Bacteroidota bacterium]|nr:T9SS type A sorting domain-containing protein [Bacteroidota bacterium]
MCYYFIDNSLRYAKSLENFSTGVLKFDPHWEDGYGNASYGKVSSFGRVRFGDGADFSDPPNFIPNVDYAEDAMVILHETGHYIHHSLAGFGGNPLDLGYDGIGEGIADYWAASEVNELKSYKDYESGFYRIFRWANWNPGTDPSFFAFPTTNRTSNTSLIYPQTGLTGHYYGQILSSVLMKIYLDIGKERTDNIVLLGLKEAGYANEQPEIADFIYQAALDEEYEDWELCIIWNHFDRTYNIGLSRFMASNPDSGPDLYMKDDVDDVGIEENPTSAVMYLSEDIWVRPTDDDAPFHDNPVYRAGAVDKTNYVYVKVRSKGCDLITDATLHVYWSKASTGLAWPSNWEYSTLNGFVISNEIGTVDLDALDIEAGEERIVKLEWIPPNPENFNDAGKHHYCLLARIASSEDDMNCTEVSNTNTNTRCNNNIVWKNVTVLFVPGYTTDTAVVYIRDILNSTEGTSCIQITDAIIPHYSSTLDNSSISINLRDSLKIKWVAGGSHGSGFSYDSESGLFNVTSFPVTFCNISLTNMKEYFLDLFVEGNGDTKPFAFDLKHYKTSPSGTLIGGERFIYPGTGEDALPRNSLKKITNSSNFVTISPNPFSDNLIIHFDNSYKEFDLKIFDLNSKLLYQEKAKDVVGKTYVLNLSELNAHGLLLLKLNVGNYQKTIKIVKF